MAEDRDSLDMKGSRNEQTASDLEYTMTVDPKQLQKQFKSVDHTVDPIEENSDEDSPVREFKKNN